MATDPEDRQRKNYILRRAIMDIGMGGLIAGFGFFFVFAPRLGYDFVIDSLLRYGFSGLCIVYGAFRIYRGIKKNYFSE